MPGTINGIGTTYYNKKNVEKYEGICEKCGKRGVLKSYEARLWFVFFFIPIIPLAKKMILDYCGKCTNHRVIPLDEWNRIKTDTISEDQAQVQADPDNPEAALKMYSNLRTFGKHEESDQLASELEKKFHDHPGIQLYLGECYEQDGMVEEADKCFERALKAAPDNTAARRAVAIACIEKNDLARASELLSFMRYNDSQTDPWVLFSLATAYQKNNRHTEALTYFETIARVFPDIARTNKDFRKAVQESEKEVGQTQTILPKRQFASSKKLKRAALVVMALTALFFIATWYLSTHQPLHVINQLPAGATITIPGQDPFIISPGERKLLKVPEGIYDVNIQVEKNPSDVVAVDISNKWYERFFINKVFILNVGKGAVILWEETTYSENPQPNDPYKFHMYVGESFITTKKANFTFEPFPETISLDNGKPELRSRVDVFAVMPSIMPSLLLKENIPVQKILTYIEAHLAITHEDENLLSNYLLLSHINKETTRARVFLEKNLHQRPVWVEWHRFYQTICQLNNQAGKLIDRYDDMIQKEPDNSALLYLRGRIEPNLQKAIELYDRAIDKDKNNSYPYFARAFYLAGKGELTAARQLCATASRLNPNSSRMNQVFYQLRFALKEYDALEKESISVLSMNPIDWGQLLRLLEIRVAKGDNAGAAKALQDFQRALSKETPQDPYQLNLKSKMKFAYLKGDFNAIVKDAAALQDESLRRENLKIAYLNLGKMEEAEKLPGIKEFSDGYTCLIYWWGWLQKGNNSKASQWLQLAAEKFQASDLEEKTVGELLKEKKPAKNLVNRLEDLSIDINYKRILYATFARIYPSLRRQLLPLAEKLNFFPEFPFHFLADAIKQLKKRK